MNRGTALKWAAEIAEGKVKLNDGSALAFDDGTFCLAGVLENFLFPDEWKPSPQWVCLLANKEKGVFTISAETVKRAKIKTDFEEVYAFHQKTPKHPDNATFFAQWIIDNYERL